MFNFLQRIGKALMTPIAVLPVAALLLRLGFGDIFDGNVAAVCKSAGEAVFGHLDLLFGVGIAYGLAKNHDGAAALSGAVGVLIAKAVYETIDKSVNMGVFVGIIMGVVAGVLYNRYHTVKLPEYLGFFGGKRFVPILTAVAALLLGTAAGYLWPYAQHAIDAFSNAIFGLGEIGTFLYGTLNRLLIPLGLHHILNSVFWFQLGEYHYLKEGVQSVANGDLHRFFAGDPSAGVYMAGFYVPMMFGLPAMALAIYRRTDPSYRRKAGALLFGVALTSFLTGITEPMEFLFMFAAPPLYALHALLTGAALAAAQALDIHAGFGFSAGLIDYVINYKLGKNVWMLLPLGLLFGAIYYLGTVAVLRVLKLDIMRSELRDDDTQAAQPEAETIPIDRLIDALGGKDNIVQADACITRLRMKVKRSDTLRDDDFKRLGAKGVIRPDNQTIQIVFGAASERLADAIRQTVSQA